MPYYTRGTIQIDFQQPANPSYGILITPARGYAVKHDGKDFTLFIEKANLPGSLLVEKGKRLEVHQDVPKEILNEAASTRICVELTILDPPTGKSVGSPFPQVIGVKFPVSDDQQ